MQRISGRSHRDSHQMTAVDRQRSRLLDEIADLIRAYAQRRASPRPMPSCVDKAYGAALRRHYQKLDALAGEGDAPSLNSAS